MNTNHDALTESATYTRDDLAKLLKVSLRHIVAMHASGRLGMKPLHFGRVVRYLASETHDWLAAGAPARDAWEAMKAAKRNGGRA